MADKKSCCVCESPVNMLNRFKIADGYICKVCAEKFGIDTVEGIASLGNASTQEVIARIGLASENEAAFKQFNPTKEITSQHAGKVFAINDQDGEWCIYSKNKKNAHQIYSYNDLIGYEVIEGDQTIQTKGGLGSSLVGGILAGGVGAVIGANVGKKKSAGKVKDIKIRVALNDINNNQIILSFLSTETKVGGFVHKSIMDDVQKIQSLLDYILENKVDPNTDTSSNFIADPISTADEILKFKQLADQGIITQEEFEAKKKELLNL